MFLAGFVKLALVSSTLFGWAALAQSPCTTHSVRREWRSFSQQERADWISAVKCLNALPHGSSLVVTYNTTYSQIPALNTSGTFADDIAYIHMDLNPAIHGTGLFLPWHRAFVKTYETSLQEKCGYQGTQPYWNWTMDASDFETSAFWDSDSTSGVGGWGDANNDYQVTDGGFVDFKFVYPSSHKLRRNYTTSTLSGNLTLESQLALVNSHVADFPNFQVALESGPHNAIHAMVGGDLSGSCPANAPSTCIGGPKWSTNDPLFFMHHAMVDKIWYDWQNINSANFWAYRGGATAVNEDPSVTNATYPNGSPPMLTFADSIPTDNILPDFTIYELMDTKSDKLCYIYE